MITVPGRLRPQGQNLLQQIRPQHHKALGLAANRRLARRSRFQPVGGASVPIEYDLTIAGSRRNQQAQQRGERRSVEVPSPRPDPAPTEAATASPAREAAAGSASPPDPDPTPSAAPVSKPTSAGTCPPTSAGSCAPCANTVIDAIARR